MNQGRRSGAYCVWLKWQLSSRLLGRRDVRWVEGLRVRTAPGDHGFTSNIATGLSEYETMAFLLHYLRGGDLFVDVGANVGSYSLLAGARSAHLIAIEPAPKAMEGLKINLRLNGLSAQLHHCAVGAKDGTLTMALNKGAASHADPSGTPVSLARLDTLLKGQGPALVKIDVEGYEGEVLTGAALTFQNLPALIIESWCDQGLRERLAAHGLTLCSYNPKSRQLKPLSLDTKSFAQSELFVRDLDAARQRLSQARPIEWCGKRY